MKKMISMPTRYPMAKLLASQRSCSSIQMVPISRLSKICSVTRIPPFPVDSTSVRSRFDQPTQPGEPNASTRAGSQDGLYVQGGRQHRFDGRVQPFQHGAGTEAEADGEDGEQQARQEGVVA